MCANPARSKPLTLCNLKKKIGKNPEKIRKHTSTTKRSEKTLKRSEKTPWARTKIGKNPDSTKIGENPEKIEKNPMSLFLYLEMSFLSPLLQNVFSSTSKCLSFHPHHKMSFLPSSNVFSSTPNVFSSTPNYRTGEEWGDEDNIFV